MWETKQPQMYPLNCLVLIAYTNFGLSQRELSGRLLALWCEAIWHMSCHSWRASRMSKHTRLCQCASYIYSDTLSLFASCTNWSHWHLAHHAYIEASIWVATCREGELIDCLMHMDEPLVKADYFTMMKRMRLMVTLANYLLWDQLQLALNPQLLESCLGGHTESVVAGAEDPDASGRQRPERCRRFRWK